MIVLKEHRIKKLLEVGVPEVFLKALEKINQDSHLRFMIKEPDGFYFYINDIHPEYECIKDYNIAPIFEGDNGDVFYVYLFNAKAEKFACFSLENDRLYSDYGTSFDLMLANLLVNLYEFADDLSIEELTNKGEAMGGKFSRELFKQLKEADDKHLRSTFHSDKKWRADNLGRIIQKANLK